jgi:hypothetical protein
MEGHYHVDVFAGPDEQFVRGFTLMPGETGTWVVHDEIGLAGPAGPISPPLTLDQSLRFALAKLYSILPQKPLIPVWGGAPLQELGYIKPSLTDRLMRKAKEKTVGPDGFAC